MRRAPRGGPGEFVARLARAERLATEARGSVREPLSVLVAVLRHQQRRAEAVPAARRRPANDRFPLLDLDDAAAAVIDELAPAADALGRAVPLALAEASDHLRTLRPSERAAVVETWLDDTTLVEPRLAFWLRVAAGPVLEQGARGLSMPDGWTGRACPACGASPQASVIAEESGEFMAGSPRSLVCGRCASWWSFPRATCVACGEDDSRRITSYLVDDQRWARIDTCATCHGYIKTFDLRQSGGGDVVPLVDDVATLILDVWAQQRGYSRAAPSLAGV